MDPAPPIHEAVPDGAEETPADENKQENGDSAEPLNPIDKFNENIQGFYFSLVEGDDYVVRQNFSILQASLEAIITEGHHTAEVPALEEMLRDCRSKCVRQIRGAYGDAIRALISQTRRKLQEKSAGITSEQVQQQRHVQLLVNLLGEGRTSAGGCAGSVRTATP